MNGKCPYLKTFHSPYNADIANMRIIYSLITSNIHKIMFDFSMIFLGIWQNC